MRAGDTTGPSSQNQPLFGYFIRAQLAHAEILGLDLEAARESDGVQMVLDAEALSSLGITTLTAPPLNIGGKSGPTPPPRPLLAQDFVRYLGEPIALIVADTEPQARAAANLVELDLMELPVVRQLVPGGEAIHPEVPGNLAFDYSFGPQAEVAAALETSAHRIRMNLGHNRVPVYAPMIEGACANWQDGRFSLHLQGPGIWADAKALARVLLLPLDSVEVVNPDLGHFSRSAAILPEYLCLALAARGLQRQVYWTAEASLQDRTASDTLARAEIGFDTDFRITALRVNLVSNLGAYASEDGQSIQTEHFAGAMTGDYDIGLASLGALGVYTNAPPLIGYSAAGRAEALLTLEQLLEISARQLQLDPVELRRRNLRTEVPPLEASPVEDGLRGFGHAYPTVPATLARIVMQENGNAALHLGCADQNGRAKAILSEATGLSAEDIDVLSGQALCTADQQLVAITGAIDRMIAGLTLFLQQDVGVKEVQFQDHDFTATGSNMRLSLQEAAEWAREKGRTELLDITAPAEGAEVSVHRAEVVVDAENGVLRLASYLPKSAETMALGILDHLVTEGSDGNDTDTAILLPNLHEMQGLSEAEAHCAAAAVVNAVQEALSRYGVRQVDLPLSPRRLRNWIQEAGTVDP